MKPARLAIKQELIMNTYTEQNIKILTEEQATEKFTFKQIEALSSKYKSPPAFVARGLEVCDYIGIEHDYFIDKYLRKLPDIRINPTFSQEFMAMVMNQHQGTKS